MTGKTHITGGIALSLLICNDFVSFILVLVGSILPDIDHNNSTLGKIIPIIPKILKHRGIMHSIWVPLILLFINKPIFYGYCLHLMFDILTKNGIKPLNPIFNFSIKIPLIKTGGIFEKMIFYLIIFSIFIICLTKYIL